MSKRTCKHVARQITVYGMEKDKLRNLRLKLDIELAETTHSGNAFQILGHIEEYRVCGRTVFFSWKTMYLI